MVRGYGAHANGVATDTTDTADAADAVTPDGGTIFQIASLSKLLTAATLQVLCDERVLDLDANLGALIGKSLPLSADAARVTLRQLATHTSGFPDLPPSFLARMGDARDPYAGLTLRDLHDYLRDSEGKRAPGQFVYSNLGMGLLAHVMESVTGERYEELVATKLLRPLGMNDTAIDLAPSLRARLIGGYSETKAPAPPWTFPILAGAGAWASSADDMLRFAAANLDPAHPLFATLRRMHGAQGIGWMAPALPDRIAGNGAFIWHNGRVGGYASYLSIDPASRTAVLVLSNLSIDITMAGIMLTRQARTQSFARAAP
jgi:CubicO group peptidase (beta-lactamase class C family)